MQYLQVERENQVAIVWLNRPDKKNALSFAVLRELVQIANQLKRDRALRAVILAGRGGTFSAGLDLSDLNNPRQAAFAAWELIKPGQSLFQKAVLIWRTLPVPVIAVLEGHSLGAGLQLALAADFRIATPDCKLALMESRWGLVPDMGITQTLQGLMPIDQAKRLAMTAEMISGEVAHQLGLVTSVSANPLAAAQRFAAQLSERSPDALLASKRVIDSMTTHTPDQALRLEKLWQLKMMLSPNRVIALKNKGEAVTQYRPRRFR